MSGRMLVLALVVVLAAAGAGFAQTGIPDLDLSICWWDYAGPERLTLLVVPDGSGGRFDQAATPDGQIVDATLRIQVIGPMGDSVANFPYEDLWLEWSGGNFVSCIGGTVADVNTDAEGKSFWLSPLEAGGHSTGDVEVLINGSMITASPPVPLMVNSPDLNGDGIVNLSDVTLFVPLYTSAYDFTVDLACDGVVNLSDVVVLAGSLGRDCP
jgi:hypothetical protein